MAESLIEQLPKVVAEGRKEVEKILERLDSGNKITLQTNEYVLPVRKEENLFKSKYQILTVKIGLIVFVTAIIYLLCRLS